MTLEELVNLIKAKNRVQEIKNIKIQSAVYDISRSSAYQKKKLHEVGVQ